MNIIGTTPAGELKFETRVTSTQASQGSQQHGELVIYGLV